MTVEVQRKPNICGRDMGTRSGEANEHRSSRQAVVSTLLTTLGLVGVVAGVFALWYYFGVKNFETFGQTEEAARYGESFGAVNALISALALAGVAIAIVLQIKGLALQRTELRLTKDELAKSATAHQQLVQLSAVSSLLQTYLEEYKLHEHDYREEFERLLRDDPGQARDNGNRSRPGGSALIRSGESGHPRA